MSAFAIQHDEESDRRRVAYVLTAIVAASTVVHAILALRLSAPQSIPDELIYSEIAKSLGDGRAPGIRDHVAFTFGLGYPIVLAPLWAVLDEVSAAYTAARLLNALLLSATAIPTYFFARNFVHSRRALLVAGLAVCVPSMLYAGLLMTEVALYPALTLAVALISRSLLRPTFVVQIAALGAIALACAVKALALTLLVVYPVSITLFHWLDSHDWTAWRIRMRSYVPIWLALAGAAAVVSLAVVARGGSLFDVLGAYAVVVENIDPLTTPWWFLLHVAELDLYLAVIPFAAAGLVAVRGFSAQSSREERLYAAIATPLILALMLVIAMYSSEPHAGAEGFGPTSARIHERSSFVLAPLFLLGLMLWLRYRRGGTGIVVVVLGVSVVLPAFIPLANFDGNVRVQALALVPWVAASNGIAWPVAGLMFSCAIGTWFLLAWRRRLYDWTFYTPVVIVFAGVLAAGHVSLGLAADWSRSGAAGEAVAWVDDAVGSEDVSVLWAEPAGDDIRGLRRHQLPLFVGEFFNRRLADVYELGGRLPYALPSTRVRLSRGRLVDRRGSPVDLGPLVLTPCHVEISGGIIAQDPATGARVVRVGHRPTITVRDPASCSQADAAGND